MRNYLFLFILFLSGLAFAETKTEYKSESDGFEWYQIRTDEWKYGAEDKNHKLLIKPQYDQLFYSTDAKGFYVSQNRYVAFFEADGKCPIPISRKMRGQLYKLFMTDDDGKQYAYFSITTPKHSIICDSKGKEILRTYRCKSVIPYCTDGKFYYSVKDVFDKHGIMDGAGELVVPLDYCSSIFISGDSLMTTDCFTNEFVAIEPVSSITTTKNLLAQ